jgi:hypothetical protein
VIDDEVPKPFASVIGHVCGVIAVGMTALSAFAIWTLAHKPTGPGLLFVSVCVGVALLMFRWAGALTGFWDTRGRLAVSKFVYSALGVVFVAIVALSVRLAVLKPPATVGEGLPVVIGVCSGGAMVYLCYLAYRRFK